MGAPQLVEFIDIDEGHTFDPIMRMRSALIFPMDAGSSEDLGRQYPGRIDDPPPSDIRSEFPHHPPDVARRAVGDGTDGPIGDDARGGNEFDDAQHPFDGYLVHCTSRQYRAVEPVLTMSRCYRRPR